jgi:hypothetical protein
MMILESSPDWGLRNPITGIVGCCARALSGHIADEAAVLPRSVMTSLRFILLPLISWNSPPPENLSAAGRGCSGSAVRTCFEDLVQPDQNTPIGRFSEFLRIFDLSTVYPLVPGLMGAETGNDELAGMLQDVESYSFRRAVCNLGTKNYNRFFLTVLSKLGKSQFSRPNLRAALVEQTGDSVVWPDNAKFKQAWLSQPAYKAMNAG